MKRWSEQEDWVPPAEWELARDARPHSGLGQRVGFYLQAQSTGLGRYALEETLYALCGWMPGLLGIGLRALAYRLIMRMRGWVAIESGVRLAQPENIRLDRGVYLDRGAYLHACPQGIDIGANTYVMHHAELHVYNFRGLRNAHISIGRNCIIGEFSVIRGQGGVSIGDNVIIAPRVQVMAVEHVFEDPSRPILEQGLRALGIRIEDDAWIGAGAIILDGVHVGRGAVVGAGAVVTRDVPPHSVVAGVPARLLRRIRRTGAAMARPERAEPVLVRER